MSASEPEHRDFHRLFVENQRQVYAFIMTLLPRPADAEEVFQDSSVIILSKEADFEPGTNFLAWACQIAQFEVFNYRRRSARQPLPFTDELLERLAEKRLAAVDRWDDRRDAMRGCLDKLSPDDRELIVLRYSRKTTSKQLAADLGRPPNTVYKAVQRIRRALRACIDRTLAREDRP